MQFCLRLWARTHKVKALVRHRFHAKQWVKKDNRDKVCGRMGCGRHTGIPPADQAPLPRPIPPTTYGRSPILAGSF